MVIDPMLRFNWIFYAIFTHDTQHSSIASFLIGFSEVTRRGLWTLLRVENEHCANVKQYKASRDVPLPYHLDLGVESDPLTSGRISSESNGGGKQIQRRDNELVRSPSAARVSWTGAVMGRTQSGRSTGIDVAPTIPGASGAVEEGRTPGEESLRMRRRHDTLGKRSIRGILADAHKQDFEKKRKPESTRSGTGRQVSGVQEEEDDDDDDDEDEEEDELDDEAGSLLDERADRTEAQMLAKKGKDEDSE